MRIASPFSLAAALILLGASPGSAAGADVPAGDGQDNQRRMVLTFDDLPAQRAQSQSRDLLDEITGGLLRALARQRPPAGGPAEHIPAVGFVNESKLYVNGAVVAERVKLLERWLDAGAELGNHSYSHPDLHRISLADFQRDVERGEKLTRPLVESKGGTLRYFRHPFLHTGRDLDTKRGLERFLAERGYEVAPVTSDNSEWIFAKAFSEALERGGGELRERLAGAYLDYMERMVEYYEGQSRALFGREIPQILLLHANALNAHHLERLMTRIRRRGYRFVDLETALLDPAYDSPDAYAGPGGITWLHRWASPSAARSATSATPSSTPAATSTPSAAWPASWPSAATKWRR